MDGNDSENDGYGPGTPVWSHLYSGLDLARMEMDFMDAKTRKSYEGFGELIVKQRLAFAHHPALADWDRFYEELLGDVWMRFTAELELGRQGIERAAEALDRFRQLRSVFTDYTPSEKSAGYLREAVNTFLFGFDAACIALCGATVEQVLKDVLVDSGEYTAARLAREQPTGLSVLKALERMQRVQELREPAERVLRQRNHVMHRSLWDARIIRNVAAVCLEDLGRVLSSLDAGGDGHIRSDPSPT